MGRDAERLTGVTTAGHNALATYTPHTHRARTRAPTQPHTHTRALTHSLNESY